MACVHTFTHQELSIESKGLLSCVVSGTSIITRYGSTLYIGIAMVVPIPQYIRKCQFLLSVSSEFDF